MENINKTENIQKKLLINAFMKSFEELNDSDKIKFTKSMKEDLKSKIVFDEMEEIYSLIDNYFNGNGDLEEIEKRILKLSKKRLTRFYDDNLKNIEEKYWNKVYLLVLYESYIGKKVLLDNLEVNFMINNKVKEELDKLINDYDIPNELFKLVVDTLNDNKLDNTKGYLNEELLKKLFAYKNGLLVSRYSKEINHKANEIEKTQGNIYVNEKAFKKNKFHSKLYTFVPLAVMTFSASLAFAASKKASQNPRNYVSYANVLEEDENYSERTDVMYDENIKYVPEYSKYLSTDFLNTERKYVTVFSDTKDNIFNIKIYDYTGSDISDEELKSIELDESKLVVDDNMDITDYNGIKEGNHMRDLGVYTGKAHRSVSSVKYELDKDYFLHGGVANIFGIYEIVCLIVSIYNGYELTNLMKKYDKSKKELDIELDKKLKELIDLLEKRNIDNIKPNNKMIENKPTLDDIFGSIGEISNLNGFAKIEDTRKVL